MSKPPFKTVNISHEPGSLYCGGMGSGKSVAATMLLGGYNTVKSYAIHNTMFTMLEDRVVFPEVKSLEEKAIMDLVGTSKVHIFSNNLTFSELDKIADMLGKSELKQYFSDYVTINNEISLDILKSMRIDYGSAIYIYELSLGKDYNSIKEILHYLKDLGCLVVAQSQPKSN